MINNLLKIGTMIVAGRWLKQRWKGLLILSAFWLVVNILHKEYVQYVQLSEDVSFVWQASLIKISLYILGLLLYIVLVERQILLKSEAKKKSNPLPTATSRELTGTDDGFDFLRKKRKLDTPSDKLLKK